jgi:hypothetical protein
MKYEGMFLVAFIFLSVILLVMVVRSEKEHFGKYSANSTLAISQLSDDVNLLHERLSAAEKKLSSHEKDAAKAVENVDKATTDIQIATS